MFQLLLGFQKNENVPSFKFLHNENKSSDPRQNIPQFMITFPDGENTTTNLSYFNALPYFNTSKPCQYLGNLNNDPKKLTNLCIWMLAFEIRKRKLFR